MVKMECFLPYLIMIVILIFLGYDIFFTILRRETFKVILVDKKFGCFNTDYLTATGMEHIEVDGDGDNNYIRFLLNNRSEVEINSGLPQTSNVSLHLEQFKKDVKGHEWQDFEGIISIMMSYWHPDWNMNYGDLKIYQDRSIDLSEKMNEKLVEEQMTEQIKQKAQEMFEESAKNILLKTLKQGKALIPEAKWGLAGSPVCTNCESCSLDNNSRFDWLFSTSGAAFPELVLHKNGNKVEKISKCIESYSKIKSKYKIKVFLNTKLTYHGEQEFINQTDLTDLIDIFLQTKNLGYDGIIISIINDPRNKEFCDSLNALLNPQDSLGKIIKELTEDWFFKP
ncbi:hypothetical protein LSTR_LSTR004860 [Laodelphax striatellus]|uniref:Hyaluronidase n=1 Tax=Laodelphax striatellus TaxID=195883 RepID=A0A482WI35_LAOST|nr:hypothetical protein LSTR_LSTR004860 [Laodelphax striatellus]